MNERGSELVSGSGLEVSGSVQVSRPRARLRRADNAEGGRAGGERVQVQAPTTHERSLGDRHTLGQAVV